jgi:hexulose-6-phosphate isomerase
MRYIGIMQGRLVPPTDGRFQSFPNGDWRAEFARARDAGLDSIEWIYDVFGEAHNPLASDRGLEELESLAAGSGVRVVSVCADYFMDRPIVAASGDELRDLVGRLYWLIERCRRARIERIVLPFVDASRLRDDADRRRALAVLSDVVPTAEHAKVELHLETDLAPQPFAAFLKGIVHPYVKVNYDAGNSASLGYRPADEFAAYGARIGSVHIKDRTLGGGTVPLGTGDADLRAVFAGLHALGYRGDYILQAARGEPGCEVELAAQNRRFVAGSIEANRTAHATPG